MQTWHIRADNERESGSVEFDLNHHQIETLIKILLKEKRNKRIGAIFREVYLDTKEGGKSRLIELGL